MYDKGSHVENMHARLKSSPHIVSQLIGFDVQAGSDEMERLGLQ